MVLLNIFLLLSLYKTVLARPIPDGLAPYPLHFPKYEFGYAVHDGFTGDIKSQHEVRHGDNVAGHYSVLDADGLKRTVEYHADDITGFNAVVHRDGQGPLHHGQHAVYPANGHPFHGGAVHPPATGPLAAGHPPPHPPPPGPHHEPPHHGHHHQHFVGALEGPVNHGHHPPPHPLPPAEFVRLHHATPVAHSSAFQRNFYQPHP